MKRKMHRHNLNDTLLGNTRAQGLVISMTAFKILFSVSVLVLLSPVPAHTQESASDKALKALDDFFKFDVPYIPTPPEVAHAMLTLAGTGPDDVLYDLGSGDGRIVIAAARDFGVKKGVGIDLDQELIARAQKTAKREGLSDRADFRVADIFETDFGDATVLTLYLLEKINVQLRPRILSDLNPGTRVISHHFNMGDWTPDAEKIEQQRHIYMWIVPADVSGIWSWSIDDQDYRLELAQKYQEVSGTLYSPEGAIELEGVKMRGDTLNFETNLQRNNTYVPISFEGTSAGNLIKATITINSQPHSIAAIRTP